ncbi:hypothetical protein [Paenibacillus medicaginis]|uniref:SIR2-like domain-containing protein n=1 Tax=Paenibacillus medicaginis TaxID=1470560 RepID=A0ABV5C1A6_9BACL
MSSSLDILKQSNEYPVVFIGSGISKKYLAGFPSWEELLQRFWRQLNIETDFYAFLNQLRNKVRESYVSATDSEVAYYTNIEAGTIIEASFNEKFYAQEIEVENFTQQQAYRTQISPFKKAISNT